MHRNLKRISYTPSYSSWLRKTSILWFIVVLQAAKCLSGREQEQKPLNGSKVNSNSSVQEKPANCKQSDSDASKTLDSDPSETNDDLIEEVELEGQLAKSNGLLGKLKGMAKQLAKLKEKFRIKFNYKKAANKKEEVDKTPENEVICLLCWAIQENDVSLVELLLDRKSNDSAVDKAGTMLWILYYALLYGDKPKEIVNLILKKSLLSLDDLWLPDSLKSGLIGPVVKVCNVDAWKSLVERTSSNSLCKCNQHMRTLLHYLAFYKKTKKFKILFAQIDASSQARAMDELFKLDKFGNSVIDYSYLSEKNHSKTLWNSSKIQSFISSRKGRKMFTCILDNLHVRLMQDQLTTIVRKIEDKLEKGIISKQYANELCSIIKDYINKKYGNEAGQVIQYMADAKGRLYADRVQYNSGMKLLGDAIEYGQLDVVEGFLKELRLEHLCVQDDNGLGFMHFAAWCKHKDIFKALFDRMHKLDSVRAIEELFRQDAKHRWSVFEYSYMPKYNPRNGKTKPDLYRLQEEGIKMFEFILNNLPFSLNLFVVVRI